nr:hypothetical protein DO63_2295 [Burkholderia pseudomallei]
MKFHTSEDGRTNVIERAEYVAVARAYAGCGACVFNEGELEDDCFEHACLRVDFPEGHLLRDTPHRIIWVRKD